eukprot:TRINITY_DN6396_c1_g1_i1.p1 TRINITY_DN6396_c1_g1~~TRINITY_DN6396_c1_g1_i1.p1  ORF type:complete len:488 (-),score=146.88 TRINITY_DN6396_c1_g1_i1:475-1938(-)
MKKWTGKLARRKLTKTKPKKGTDSDVLDALKELQRVCSILACATFMRQPQSAASGGGSTAVSAVNSTAKTVLWVDDKPDNNAAEVAEMQASGIELVQATSTQEAVAWLEAHGELAKAHSAVFRVITDSFRPEDGEYAAQRLIEYLRTHKWRAPVFVYVSCDPVDVISLEGKFAAVICGKLVSVRQMFSATMEALEQDDDADTADTADNADVMETDDHHQTKVAEAPSLPMKPKKAVQIEPVLSSSLSTSNPVLIAGSTTVTWQLHSNGNSDPVCTSDCDAVTMVATRTSAQGHDIVVSGTRAGVFECRVMVDGQEAKNSPFEIAVVAADVSVQHCVMNFDEERSSALQAGSLQQQQQQQQQKGVQVIHKAGVVHHMIVELFDAFGNAVTGEQQQQQQQQHDVRVQLSGEGEVLNGYVTQQQLQQQQQQHQQQQHHHRKVSMCSAWLLSTPPLRSTNPFWTPVHRLRHFPTPLHKRNAIAQQWKWSRQ